MDPELVVSVISVVVAIAAALSAIRSSRAARSSARTAEIQAQLSYQSVIGEAEPSATLEFDSVTYRWSADRDVLTPGTASDPGVTSTDLVTMERARSMGLQAEIVLHGRLVNHRPSQLLVTYRGSWPDAVRFPLKNQSLFLIDGREQEHMTVPAEDSLEFVWIDRRSVDMWRELYIATEDPRGNDDELKIPEAPVLARLREELKILRDPLYSPSLSWKAKIQESNGFRLVVEGRAAERIATVWRVQPNRAPIERREWDGDGKMWRWGIRDAVRAPIDDDVIFYRFSRDATLAQIDPPRERWVPGRF